MAPRSREPAARAARAGASSPDAAWEDPSLEAKAKRAREPRIAMARAPAAREIALLTPEATPEKRALWAPMTVEVNGATVKPIPRPKSAIPGKKLAQYADGPRVIPGRARAKNPSPTRAGPRVRKRRGPLRSAMAPAGRARSVRMRAKGRKARPAWVLE